MGLDGAEEPHGPPDQKAQPAERVMMRVEAGCDQVNARPISVEGLNQTRPQLILHENRVSDVQGSGKTVHSKGEIKRQIVDVVRFLRRDTLHA